MTEAWTSPECVTGVSGASGVSGVIFIFFSLFLQPGWVQGVRFRIKSSRLSAMGARLPSLEQGSAFGGKDQNSKLHIQFV
jgi:hypothetical protein